MIFTNFSEFFVICWHITDGLEQGCNHMAITTTVTLNAETFTTANFLPLRKILLENYSATDFLQNVNLKQMSHICWNDSNPKSHLYYFSIGIQKKARFFQEIVLFWLIVQKYVDRVMIFRIVLLYMKNWQHLKWHFELLWKSAVFH